MHPGSIPGVASNINWFRLRSAPLQTLAERSVVSNKLAIISPSSQIKIHGTPIVGADLYPRQDHSARYAQAFFSHI